MTKVTLPRLNQTGTNEWSDVQSNDEAIATIVNGELDHTNLSASAAITGSQLASSAGITNAQLAAAKLSWYTPKITATEQIRESTGFGYLATEDKIENVVLPENGLIVVGYAALVKSSVSGAGRAAIFLGSNQLKNGAETVPTVQEASTSGTGFTMFNSATYGLRANAVGTSFVTTGQTLNVGTFDGGVCYIFAAAGTYAIGVQYKATSGSVTAKERKLWVATLG